ncbi:MAG: hypothetical protein OT477_23465 [Chloroflexi bacterium]|nr:hypothetical protein [Chloroflexota bacterium]
MRTFFTLFTRQSVVLIALVLVYLPVQQFGLDERLGMALVGLVFGFSGVGHVLTAEQETQWGCLHRGFGTGLIIFCLFTAVVMAIMFVRGEELGTPPR